MINLKKLKLSSSVNFGIAYTLASGIQKGVGFLVFMYLGSVLSISEYSDFGLKFSVYTLITLLASAGLQESVVSLMNQNREELSMNRLYRAANSIFVYFSVFIVLVTVVISLVITTENYSFKNNLLIALGAIFTSFFLFQSLIIRLEEKHLDSITLSFFPSLLGYIFGFVFFTFYKTSISFFEGIVFITFLLILLFSFKYKGFKGFGNSITDLKNILNRVLPFAIISFWGWALGYGNTFIIKYLFLDYDVALFVFIYTISSIIQLVATSMNQVWAPKFYKLYNIDSIEEIEKKNILFSTAQGLVLGISGLTILIAFPILVNHFEKFNKFGNAKLEMFFLFSAYIVSIPWWHCQNYFMINDKGKTLMNITMFSSFIGYAIWIISMIMFGKIGIYLGFFIQSFVRSILVYYIASKKWQIKFDWKGILVGLFILAISFIINI
ncbi:MAG: hypothetical protein CFE25_01800 [Chitinophagaceae bacterium BSSC1]|nr:MAG: hypothetical protein CFE25_01800 [Chitinophagaceae bacterium BSSC1]